MMHLKQFHGGLNSSANATDISDHECEVADNCSFDIIGQIRNAGHMKNAPSPDPADERTLLHPGRGLFAFSHDRDRDGTLTPVDYYASHDRAALKVWDTNDTTWTDIVNSGTNPDGSAKANWGTSANVHPTFLFQRGVLRVCDATHANSLNEKVWWGYINRTHFPDITPGGSADTYTGMFSKEANIAGPAFAIAGKLIGSGNTSSSNTMLETDESYSGGFNGFDRIEDQINAANAAGTLFIALDVEGTTYSKTISAASTSDVLTTTASGDTWNGTNFEIFPPAGSICLDINVSTGGSIPDEEYEFGVSYIYDEVQESTIVKCGDSDHGIALDVGTNVNELSPCTLLLHTPYDARLVGCRIYIRLVDLSTKDWTLLWDVDFNQGVRLNFESEFSGTYVLRSVTNSLGGADTNEYVKLALPVVSSLGTDTYRNINGYDSDADIDLSYKSAAVVEGVTYAGNVIQNGVEYPDRVIKCATVLQGISSDVFPVSNFIDITPADGDEIIKLETYADRVLVFKKRKLFIVNYDPSKGDYLEQEYQNMGIDHPASSFPTPHGIAFMNADGVHLYNGETVVTLTGKIEDPDVLSSASGSTPAQRASKVW